METIYNVFQYMLIGKNQQIEILANSDFEKTGVITLGYFINFS